jgi:hypothetical protein
MFRVTQEPSSGSSPVLGLNDKYGFYYTDEYSKNHTFSFSQAQDRSLMMVPA